MQRCPVRASSERALAAARVQQQCSSWPEGLLASMSTPAADKENVAPAGGAGGRSSRRKGLGAMPSSNVQGKPEEEGLVKKPATGVSKCLLVPCV